MPSSIESLKKRHKDLFENHRCNVSDNAYEDAEKIKKAIDQLSKIENRKMSIFDLNKMQFIFRDNQKSDKFDHPVFVGIDEDSFEAFYDNIHPDDLYFALETGLMSYDYAYSVPPSERTGCIMKYEFRVKSKTGKYVWVNFRIVIYELDSNGDLWLLVFLSDIIPNQDQNRKPKRILINVNTGKTFNYFDDTDIVEKPVLSKREIDVIKLLSEGYCSKEIADRLFISINTVNKHRHSILEKTNSENTAQAVLYATRLGLI